MPRNALGRGLGALIREPEPQVPATPAAPPTAARYHLGQVQPLPLRPLWLRTGWPQHRFNRAHEKLISTSSIQVRISHGRDFARKP